MSLTGSTLHRHTQRSPGLLSRCGNASFYTVELFNIPHFIFLMFLLFYFLTSFLIYDSSIKRGLFQSVQQYMGVSFLFLLSWHFFHVVAMVSLTFSFFCILCWYYSQKIPEFWCSQWYSSKVTSTHCVVNIPFIHSNVSFTMFLILLQIVILFASVLNIYRDKVWNLAIHLSWCYTTEKLHNLFVLLLSPWVHFFFH